MKAPELNEGQVAEWYASRVPGLNQRGARWRGPCPVHGGERESFSVSAEHGGAVCHSSCDRKWDIYALEMELGHASSIKEAIGNVCELVGLAVPAEWAQNSRQSIPAFSPPAAAAEDPPLPDPPPFDEAPPAEQRTGAKKKNKARGKIVRTYDYTDERGALIYQQVRMEPKDFRRRRPDPERPGEWIWKMGETAMVPFRLPALMDADRVVIVEGEEDVLALERLGFVATTTGSKDSWKPEFAEWFHGKRVAIMPDQDLPGYHYATAVATDLLETAAEVRVVHVPIGKDARDWITATGATAADAANLIRRGRVLDGRDDLELLAAGPVDRSWRTKVTDVAALKWRPTEWLVKDLIPKGAYAVFAGRGGSLKSTMLFDLCRCVATGAEFALMHETVRTPVLTLDRENPQKAAADVRRRLQADGMPKGNWIYWGDFAPNPDVPEIDDPRVIDWAYEHQGLIVVDSLRRFHKGSERDNDDLAEFSKKARYLRRLGATVIVIHHAGKGEDNPFRGGTEIVDGSDMAVSVVRDGDSVTLKPEKNRFAREMEHRFHLGTAGFE